MVGERVIVFSPKVVDKYVDDPDVMFVNRAVPHSWYTHHYARLDQRQGNGREKGALTQNL